MDPWVLWAIAALALLAVELMTGTLVLAVLSGGAIAAAGLAALDLSAGWQVAGFAVVSAVLLVVVKPLSKRRQTPQLRSGTDALVGESAKVTAEVSGDGGQVRIKGEVWSARSFDGSSVYEPGSAVIVLEIEGATALVG